MTGAGTPVLPGAAATAPAIAGAVAFWAAVALWMAVEVGIAARHRVPPAATIADRWSRWLLIALVWASVALGVGLAATVPGTALAGLPGPEPEVILAAGLALMLGGLAVRLRAVQVLGRAFTCTVATRPDQDLVDSGPYRWIRHPSYAGGLLTVLGALLCCDSALSLVAIVLPAAGYAYRIRVEEAALLRALGDRYASYMRRTRRLLPHLL